MQSQCDPLVALEGVSFTYEGAEKPSIEDVTFRVFAGQCVLLCGPSGCGKTTVTKLINGLVPHYQEGIVTGRVTVAGLDVAATPLYRMALHVGSVFQNPKSQFFNLDSDSELAFGLENQGVPQTQILQRVKETVHALALESLRGRQVFELSGGQKQALALGSIAATDPDIYVLDEPTANLDAQGIARLRDLLCRLKASGKTIVIAEHRLSFLKGLVDQVLLMEEGKVTGQWEGDAFFALSSSQREAFGLRSLAHESPDLPSAHQGKGILRVQNLKVKLKGRSVFEDLSFSAQAGDVIGVVGANGVGKTTLMRCLAGLVRESKGQVQWEGKSLKPRQRQKLCAMVMQDVNHQLFGQSVQEECELSTPAESLAHIDQVLAQVQLESLKDRHPMSLSGGQKQRLALATGLLAQKRILILDEPTSGLDYRQMRRVGDEIKKIARQGKVVLIVTHDLELLETACTKILRLGSSAVQDA